MYRSIGLMSGTSLDGIDAALLETDGEDHVEVLGFVTIPYEDFARAEIRKAFGERARAGDVVRQAEDLVTDLHIEVIKKTGWQADIIGFHGQTIYHNPKEGLTIQIGDGPRMAEALGMDVVYDFRSADVAAGGQGAPLLPLYHKARAAGLDGPVAILNIGGVANVTWIGKDGEVLAFDTGPGNALMDDWAQARAGRAFDENGLLARAGHPADELLARWLAHPYFEKSPPKSLDRNEWDISEFGKNTGDMGMLGTEDGAATLLAFTVQSILKALDHLPEAPKAWYICGGGRRNEALMVALAQCLPVHPVEDLGWNGDATEAEGFAYLAVRSLRGLPITLPETTGAPKPLTGGVLCKAPKA